LLPQIGTGSDTILQNNVQICKKSIVIIICTSLYALHLEQILLLQYRYSIQKG
jgi:hypothetical protein